MKGFVSRLKNPLFILGVLGILFNILTNLCHLNITFPNWQIYANIASIALTGVGVYSTFGITSPQSLIVSAEEAVEGVVDAFKVEKSGVTTFTGTQVTTPVAPTTVAEAVPAVVKAETAVPAPAVEASATPAEAPVQVAQPQADQAQG